MKHLQHFFSNISESAKFKLALKEIDSEDEGFKYFVGYIKKRARKKNYSWVNDGIFKGFNDHKSALRYIDELKTEGISEADIEIFPPHEYSKIKKLRFKDANS